MSRFEEPQKSMNPSNPEGSSTETLKSKATSTVGRGKVVNLNTKLTFSEWSDEYAALFLGNSLEHYKNWEKPTVIVSDGAYGVLGFEGDTSDHIDLPNWYQPHIEEWSKAAMPCTTLWFWNSEIGWAAVHPILEQYGWRYVNCNVWNKGKAHIAGNVNTAKIRRFPVVTEVCVQYVREVKLNGFTLKAWLLNEWKRSGLPLRRANDACGVANAATRKYFDRGHLWYFPPPEMFERLVNYANEHGSVEGKPYFSLNGHQSLTGQEWSKMRSKFRCPHGFTNVWERQSLRGDERVKISSGKALHLNQKPLDLMNMIIESSSDAYDVVWEPFGGLFSASLASKKINRKAYSCEIDPDYFYSGVQRFNQEVHQYSLL